MARILIVDDNATVRRFLEVVLSRSGHETHLASDGDDALRLHGEIAPDLVILDIFMPRKDGIQTILELRRRASTLPIIALSAGGGPSARSRSPPAASTTCWKTPWRLEPTSPSRNRSTSRR